ncbi:MAG: shikimate dehydrogenase [Clostridia bacterium]|nr:shikimate dehydrogenase [Clostridia bacterium]
MEFGLIGEKLGHSYSLLIHQAFGDYDYQLCPVRREDLPAFMEKRSFRGINVTIPYKTDVLPYCDQVSDTVKAIGCANTLFFRGSKLCAENTDLKGFLFMLDRAGISLVGKKVLILGSGGTSLTARAACRERGARECLAVSRKGPVTYEAVYESHLDADVVINATPVGMYPNNLVSPVDIKRFSHLCGVVDVIYNPARTALLLDAGEAGIPCAGGLWMLAAQGWYAAQLFLDREIPRDRIDFAVRSVRRACLNLILIGMPGSGKTSLGRAAAEKLGRPFVDLDQEIEKRHGPIPDIFKQYGEAKFREWETEAVLEFGKQSGLVISTGGGAVTRGDNVRALCQNGVIGWIRRPVTELSTEGRPLSQGLEALQKMEEERAPLYAACADFSLENRDTLEAGAQKLTEGFYEAADRERP